MRRSLFRAFYCMVLFKPFLGFAAETPERELSNIKRQLIALQKSVSDLSETVKKQQEEIARLRTTRAKEPIQSTSSGPTSSSARDLVSNTPQSTRSGFVPDIGIVGDIVGTSTESHEDEEGNDRLSLRELELVFGHDIDPYSRFDTTLTFSDQEDPDIEEAYVSYWDLPFELKGRIGRIRQKVGKASASHRDSLDTVDEPLVVQDIFGVEGLFRTGIELAGFTPLSSESGAFAQELTIGGMEGGVGEDGTLFGDSRRRPSFYTHLKNFMEITDLSSLEVGGTYLLGSQDNDSGYEVNAFGIDATYIYNISSANRFKFQNEIYIQDRGAAYLQEDDEIAHALDTNPWGFYSLVDYRLSTRWGLGTRYDYLVPIQHTDLDQRGFEQAVAGYLTFFQSEFARWRFQYEHAQLSDGTNDNRFFLQGTFAIGAHKHQLQ